MIVNNIREPKKCRLGMADTILKQYRLQSLRDRHFSSLGLPNNQVINPPVFIFYELFHECFFLINCNTYNRDFPTHSFVNQTMDARNESIAITRDNPFLIP